MLSDKPQVPRHPPGAQVWAEFEFRSEMELISRRAAGMKISDWIQGLGTMGADTEDEVDHSRYQSFLHTFPEPNCIQIRSGELSFGMS